MLYASDFSFTMHSDSCYIASNQLSRQTNKQAIKDFFFKTWDSHFENYLDLVAIPLFPSRYLTVLPATTNQCLASEKPALGLGPQLELPSYNSSLA